MAYDIFISYRRGGGKEIARPLKEALASKGYKVFLDFDELTDGFFDERIFQAIDEAPVFMIILTEHALDRCADENDWVRKEIEYALLKNKNIIPVNPDKQFRSFPEEIPEVVKSGIGQHQFSVLDTEQLFVESLDKIEKNRIRPVIRQSRKENHKRWLFIGLGALAVLSCIIGIRYACKINEPKVLDKAYALYQGSDGPVDKEKAFKLFKRLGRRGNEVALFNLGVMYAETGDFENAAKAYEKAANKGYGPACRTLATYYQKGKGVPQDERKAAELTMQAANAGDIIAFYNLGAFYYGGIGVEKNYETAYQYLEYAANQGYSSAMVVLSDMLMNGEGTFKDPEQACLWLERASAAGNAEAQCKLGINYLYGNGAEKNLTNGIHALLKAGEAGYGYAYEVLIQTFLDDSLAWKDPLFSLIFLDKFPEDSDGYTYYANKIREAKGDSHLYLLDVPSEESLTRICGVGRGPKETVIYFSIKNEDSRSIWYSLDNEMVLQAGGETYHFFRSRNIPIFPERSSIEAGQTEYFYLVFPALPENVNTFDVIEQGDSGWKFHGVRLENEWI